MNDQEWKGYARGLLKAELAKRNCNYVLLSEKLSAIGVHDSPQNLSNKIARGTFSAVFFLQVLDVIGCDHITLRD
ncbi:DUF6471 domain-containing protein [Pseudokordiimonas caeni]|uniref:DUF6471 domain-containing protein n=1 Tax=Pseudokordiimonas caeni TaxID=2997908 RepID=UPI0028110095|nr:DUF6471 domain-containing protein [Pseudokordiimonas caeni]